MIITTGTSNQAQDQEEGKREDDESYEVIQGSDDQDENTDFKAEELNQPFDKSFIKLDKRDLELEILSNIDPNDEFLQSEKSFSLIDGVSS